MSVGLRAWSSAGPQYCVDAMASTARHRAMAISGCITKFLSFYAVALLLRPEDARAVQGRRLWPCNMGKGLLLSVCSTQSRYGSTKVLRFTLRICYIHAARTRYGSRAHM